MSAVEANADGLIGPTHSYAGLSPGNLASSLNKGEASNPRAHVIPNLPWPWGLWSPEVRIQRVYPE